MFIRNQTVRKLLRSEPPRFLMKCKNNTPRKRPVWWLIKMFLCKQQTDKNVSLNCSQIFLFRTQTGWLLVTGPRWGISWTAWAWVRGGRSCSRITSSSRSSPTSTGSESRRGLSMPRGPEPLDILRWVEWLFKNELLIYFWKGYLSWRFKVLVKMSYWVTRMSKWANLQTSNSK